MSGYPVRYVIYDTETRQVPSRQQGWHHDQVFRLGTAKVVDPQVYGTGRPVWIDFDHPDTFRDYLLGMPHFKDDIYLFAHNIGFDLRAVPWWRWVTAGHFSLFPPPDMPRAGAYKTPLFVIDGGKVIIRMFRTDGQRYLIYDTFNWWPMRLAEIGEAIRHPKQEMPPWEATDTEWFTYCRNDVEVLYKALHRLWSWLDSYRVPRWGPTPASVAMTLYVQRYARKRITKPEDPKALSLDRLAYYGGRLECFRVGVIDRHVFQIDINGLYPRVMLDHPYPCRVESYDHSAAPRDPPHDLRHLGTTAEVFLITDETPYPVRGLDGTYWCRGRVRTTLAGPELQAAITAGHVCHVGRWTHYDMADLFTAYVHWLWRQRTLAKARGDTLVASACKSMLNSLHGKFGQRDGEWHYEGRVEKPGDYLNGKNIGKCISGDVDIRVLDGHRFCRCLDNDHERSFVPIAAWCASYARLYMDSLIETAGPANVYQIKTDSLYVNGEGLGYLQAAGMVDEHALGKFKLEDTYTWLNLMAPNQELHDHGHKLSGIKKGGPPPQDGVYEVEEWQSFAEAIFSGNVTSISTRKRLKRPCATYTGRYVHEGGATSPWEVDNWDLTPEAQSMVPVRRHWNGGKE